MKASLFLFALFAVFGAIAHPGGLDANGGHTDRKTGVYHYHRGTNAPSGNTLGKSPSPQLAPAPEAAPLQDPEAGSAPGLNNLPWSVYLIGLGCGCIVLVLASSYYQKRKAKL